MDSNTSSAQAKKTARWRRKAELLLKATSEIGDFLSSRERHQRCTLHLQRPLASIQGFRISSEDATPI